MIIGFSAYVLMGNDFPDSTYFTKRAADREIARLKAKEERDKVERPWTVHGPGIHWKVYQFAIGPQLRIPSLAELAWRRRIKG